MSKQDIRFEADPFVREARDKTARDDAPAEEKAAEPALVTAPESAPAEGSAAFAEGAESANGIPAQNAENDGSETQNDKIKPAFSKEYIVYLLKAGFKRYFIDAFTGMAQGLFCTLIAGTILGQIGGWIQGAGTDAGVAIGGGMSPLPTSPRCSWERA